MECLNWKRCTWFLFFLAMFAAPICWGDTDPRDVNAINSLYASLGFPPIPGWVPNGGDPCGMFWQGVQCVNANITGIVLSGANLGGQLSEEVGAFASIIILDLSNNQIGGGIPTNLPTTLQQLSLSGNQLTGSIPPAISSLAQVSVLLLNDNHLIGVIPEAFPNLKALNTLDLSGNQLSGQLPDSVGDLTSLRFLHLQNNQLSGSLNVLRYLPLKDLNIENNLFSGPIPVELLSIPDFRKAGNPFNTTVIPSPPALPPSFSPSGALAPDSFPQTTGPSPPEFPHSGSGESDRSSTKTLKWVPIAGGVVLIFLALGLCLLMSWCCNKRRVAKKVAKSHEMYSYSGHKENPINDQSLQKPFHQAEKVSNHAPAKPVVGDGKDQRRNNPVTRLDSDRGNNNFNRNIGFVERPKDHKIDISSELDVDSLVAPPRPPFPLLSAEVSVSDPILPLMTSRKRDMKSVNSVKFFTVASLQQHTNSFSQANFIGDGMIGRVYKAELPSGKLLAVKKLDTAAFAQQSDEEFLELVSNVSKLKHANILELVGYCAEYGQRLLVYEYCTNGTLYEALHLDDGIHKSLSWNVRMRLALQVARALEYLHEVCEPPIMHKNFKSANILLDDDLNIRVSDCGLAPLLPPNSTTQLQGHGYGAPELELGGYTYQSDVYSFGVVMLELLTGRKSYDRSRPRGEQTLVRWAIPRLHDIDTLSKMVDPSLNGAYPSKSLSRVADIISLCIQRDPEFRPPMSEIVESLLHINQ